ncbi:MAG: glycosyltransferase family 9 protein [Acidobacteriota bacterium]
MRLLIIYPGAIGDFILALPALKLLKQGLDASYLELWVERPNLPLAGMCNAVSHAVALADSGFDCYPLPERVLKNLRSFDRVVSWRGFKNEELVQAVRTHHKEAHFFPFLPDLPDTHALDFRIGQVTGLVGAAGEVEPVPRLDCPKEQLRQAKELLREQVGTGLPVAIVHPGASSDRKRWSTAKFSRLLVELKKVEMFRVTLCFGPLEQDDPELTALGASSDVPTLVAPDLDLLAGVLSCSSLYIGNDTGISHLAAACGVPTIAIFTVTQPECWAPRGPLVGILRNPEVDDVIRGVRRMMQAVPTLHTKLL